MEESVNKEITEKQRSKGTGNRKTEKQEKRKTEKQKNRKTGSVAVSKRT
ncbi:MAG: hypothetical protein LIO99_01930 [Clostridiales bacterium]|nr:hypothetical protein [Clostridiales bacterium]